jgi:hypothetical protein
LGKEISVKTLNVIAFVGMLIATSVVSTTAWAAQANSTDVNAPLLDAQGNQLTLGQMAMKFAAHLNPPFITTDPARAMDYLRGVGEGAHVPPLSPIGGWGDGSRPATVGDLTVVLVQQFKIEVTPSTPGGQPTAQDYQSALTGFAGSVNVTTYNGMHGIFRDWVAETINPLGPTPTDPNRS